MFNSQRWENTEIKQKCYQISILRISRRLSDKRHMNRSNERLALQSTLPLTLLTYDLK